jgi:hypothetical protein
MSAEITFIYVLIDPIDNLIKYVGKSDTPEKRRKQHIQESVSEFSYANTLKVNWIKNIVSQGLEPVMQIIDEVPKTEWRFWEKHWEDLLLSWGFPLKNGDDCGRGGLTSQTQEARKKIRFAYLNKSYEERYGVEKAAQIKQKLRDYRLNMSTDKKKEFQAKRKEKITPERQREINKKVSASRLGQRLSEAQKKKISQSLKASTKRKQWLETLDISKQKNPKYRGKVYQYSKDKTTLIKEWEGLFELQAHSFNVSNISSVLTGKLKSAYGFYWSRTIL